MSEKFQQRLTRPVAGNKYYMTKDAGGYSDACKGNPTDAQCNVLSNCVGYAYGRFNEIGGWGSCKYLRPVNAENFGQYAGGLQVGKEPRVGSCMVWQKGATLSNSDGAGHVAIVEQVISDTEVLTSESGWGSSTPFYTQRRSKGTGNWGMGSAYKFLYFIYNPAECCGGAPEEKPGESVSYTVKITASGLNVRKGPGTNYAVCGGVTRGQTLHITEEKDGWGQLSNGGWISLEWAQKLEQESSASDDVLYTGTVTASILNVRNGPGTNYAVISGLARGTSCQIVQEENGWGKIASGGWVFLDYIKRS